MTTRVEYGIHPAIGFARVGDLPLDLGDRSSYNLGPERPGWRHWPPAGYDLKQRVEGVGRIKKQGARFRVHRRRWIGETCHEDILDLEHPEVRRLTWRVLVRNCKPVGPRIFSETAGLRNVGRQATPADRAALILDPGVVYVEGRHQRAELASGKPMPAGFRIANNHDPITTLGTAASDRKGNLIVFGGGGRAVSDAPGSPGPDNVFNNDDWFDDTCDGSIRAEVELVSGEVIHFSAIAPSWVVSCPPDFAPHVPNMVSIFDVLRDVGVRMLASSPNIYEPGRGFRADWRPRFVDDIEPILLATARVRATASGARSHVSKFADYTATGHPPGSKTAAELFAKLRRPPGFDAVPGNSGSMPDLSEATLTPTQYWAMHQWAKGLCDAGSQIDALTRGQQATRAALEQAVGAAFHPGIEVTHSLVDASWFLTTPRFEYRIDPAKLTPGDVSRSMALPWHTDFRACGSNWWPTIRPGEVDRGGQVREWDEGIASNREMVDKWSRLGWIDGSLVEVERDREV